mmetsp:Transcript_2763/g.5942  ORF Transcript_2763/g.5942 Transcript_2763/m.5942 type:complete len:300 (+) Transcript_2763:859-1758(+)
MISFAAESLATSSLYSVFSFFRSSVASATLLSNSLIPVSRAFNSAFSAEMPSPASAIAFAWSEIVCSRPFFLSSCSSNCAPQYSFLWSSLTCSFFRRATRSSIIFNTFSNPACLPWRAMAMRSNSGFRATGACTCCALEINANALALMVLASTFSCKSPTLGSVFLKRSRASSSFKTLMVSARVRSSSARVSFRSSHSFVFVAQSFERSARNPWSAAMAAMVSSRSWFSAAICTASSPTRLDFVSTAVVRTATSFFFAAISSSYATTEEVSSSVIEARLLSMSSLSCCKIPVISPLFGI